MNKPPITLNQEDVVKLILESQQAAKNGTTVIVGHGMSMRDDEVSNHIEVGKWAEELGCKVEYLGRITAIDIVPIGYREVIFPPT